MKGRKLHLRFHPDMIQGRFSLQKLNLLLVFQVNCPGCLVSALPLLNRLQQDKRFEHMSFLALSTAFEDASLNTRANTEALVKRGELVGASRAFFESNGHPSLPYTIDVPVAMDVALPDPSKWREIITSHHSGNSMTSPELNAFQNRLLHYFQQLPVVHHTFAVNGMQGTPTFVLFDKTYGIHASWFGHKSSMEVVDMLLHVSTF